MKAARTYHFFVDLALKFGTKYFDTQPKVCSLAQDPQTDPFPALTFLPHAFEA